MSRFFAGFFVFSCGIVGILAALRVATLEFLLLLLSGIVLFETVCVTLVHFFPKKILRTSSVSRAILLKKPVHREDFSDDVRVAFLRFFHATSQDVSPVTQKERH